MELKIERFKDMRSLVAEKDEQRKQHDEWTERQKELRRFYNGQPIMTESDADEESLEEITNHLIGYSNMQVMETRMYSLWSTSNKFIDVNVIDEKLDLAVREDQSSTINYLLNKAIYKTTRFGAFMRSVAGELAMAGRVACIHKEDSDWCPSTAPKILIPDNVGTDASELTYFFTPVEFTYAQLESLLDQGPDDESDDDVDDDAIDDAVEVNDVIVRQLMETIDQQLDLNDTQMSADSDNERPSATNTDDVINKGNKTTVNLWKYYEVRYDEENDSKVIDVLIFSDEFRSKTEEGDGTDDDKDSTQESVAFYPAFYKHPSEWGHLIVSDASIGGDKRFKNAKGIAEITYNSDIDAEELLNRIFSGEKMRAMPRFQEGDGSDEDKLLGWNPEESTLVPKGLTEFRFGGGTGGLNNPLSLLTQNSSRQSGGGLSNTGRDQELRVQQQERQGNNQSTAFSRTADLFKSMEIIAHEIVRRFFVGEVEGGSPGYEEVMWFRALCKKKGIDLRRLSKRLFGFYENIDVRIVRSSATGEIDHDMRVAERLMQNLGNYPAAVRPLIVKKYTTLISGDPDFSDDLVALLPKIVSAQRVTAESEFEQISRDAAIGVATPVGEDDVHIEHIPTHNKHLRVVLNRNLTRGWTREDAVTFAGIQEHQMIHMREALENNASRADAEQYLREFQSLVNEGQKFLAEVERGELEQQGVTDQELERQLQLREQDRKEMETQIKMLDTQSNVENRVRRRDDVRRQSDQRFLVEKTRLDRE